MCAAFNAVHCVTVKDRNCNLARISSFKSNNRNQPDAALIRLTRCQKSVPATMWISDARQALSISTTAVGHSHLNDGVVGGQVQERLQQTHTRASLCHGVPLSSSSPRSVYNKYPVISASQSWYSVESRRGS